MKPLYSSKEVMQTIKSMFSSSKGRRVVITAFVGEDAAAYLPNPKGIELICWPKEGGTNPNAIRDLKNREVKIYFCDSLHMKIYWTEDKGAVITSANLTTNALGAGGLKEFGILLPSNKIDINRIIDSIKRRPASNKDILELDNKHKEYIKRNRTSNYPVGRIQLYDEWYKTQPRQVWKFFAWSNTKVNISSEAMAVLKNEHNSSNWNMLMQVPNKNLQDNDWVLCIRKVKKQIGSIDWVFAHHQVKIKRSDKEYERDCPYQIIQVFNSKSYGPPPFKCEKYFKVALKAAIDECGGISKLEKMQSAKLSSKLIDVIYKYFQKQRT